MRAGRQIPSLWPPRGNPAASRGRRWAPRTLALTLLTGSNLVAQSWQAIDDAAVAEELRRYVEDARQAPGAVAGIWERDAPPERRFRYFVAGTSGDPSVPLGPETMFELGSITKGFTGLLLADWSLTSGRPLDTPLGDLRPDGERPDGAWRHITLLELATHRSGLPRLPLQPQVLLPMLLREDPYAGTTPDDVWNALVRARLRPGAGPSYSNLGYAVLGQALAAAQGRPYDALLRERVLEPLGVADLVLSPELAPASLRARGFARNFRPTAAWHLDAYAPAGGLVGGARPLLEFLARMAEQSPPVWQTATAARARMDDSGRREIGLGWMRRTGANGTLISHGGGTGGFRTFCGVVPQAGLALVVLTNAPGDVSGLALRLIDPARPSPTRTERPWFPFLLAGFGVLLAPGLAWLAASARPVADARRRAPDRVDLLVAATGATLLLGVAEAFGAWQWLPFALWWAGLLAALAALYPALRGWSDRAWLTGGGWSRSLRLAQVAVFAVASVVVLS